jgi:hypothetical protein
MTKPKPKPGLYVPVYVNGEVRFWPHGYEAEMDRQMHGRGRPSKASTAFKGYAAVLGELGAPRAVVKAWEFLARDAALYAAGVRDLYDRADKADLPYSTYRKRLTRARKVCPDYPRPIRGQKTA